MTWTAVGRVASLHRYPVKSMSGETLATATIGSGGVAGDRRCALIDTASGRVASAKLPHRWKMLLQCRARLGDDARIVIELPDGTETHATSASERLSALLGRSVTISSARPDGLEIERADPDALAAGELYADPAVLPLAMGLPDAGFADFAPIHFVSTSSLAMMGAEGPEPARYRPNLVIDTGLKVGFAENCWIGRHLLIGDRIELEVILPTPRCAVPTLPQPDLAAAPGITQALGRINRLDVPDFGLLACLGAYARVITPGMAAVGDEVHISG